MKFIVGLFILFNCITSFAYIPSSEFILDRASKKGGRGSYKLSTELSFQGEDQSSVIKETWYIKDGNNLFLDIRGKTFQKFILYKGSQKFYIDDSKQIHSAALPADFYENIFFQRDLNTLRRELIAKKLLPARALHVLPKPKTLKDVKPLNENFVHLFRNRGVINYVFGEFEEPNDKGPGIWIEQDKFVIRKIRLPSEAEISADDVSDFSQGLAFPKSMHVNWGNQSAQIELLRADSTIFKEEVFSLNYLKAAAEKSVAVTDPAVKKAIDEFYTRFR